MLDRRRLLISVAATGISAPVAVKAFQASVTGNLPTPTPEQTSGPFYPREFPVDHDNDLARFASAGGPAAGEVVHLEGQVFDGNGEPFSNATVDLWQCDSNGIYHHPRDRTEGRDENFQGFGRTSTDSEGRYAFRTIRPAPYPGRTPHFHLRVWQGEELLLTTQCYDADEADANARDGIYAGLSNAEKNAVTVDFAPRDEGNGEPVGRFDMRLA